VAHDFSIGDYILIKNMTSDEILNLPTLSFDDFFEFTCKACGKCCKRREDILLSPYDLFRIAVYFNRTPQEILERYCECYTGGTSHFPVVRLLPVPPDNSCPFLRNKKCSIHAKKPAVCRVFPLARMFTSEGQSRYIFNGSGCKHEPNPVTVREWIADFAEDEAEEAGQVWRDALISLYPKIMGQALPVMVGGLWLAYDIVQPFVPQLKANVQRIERI
jgi:Fe-S-cluster containining protein